jgi:hypothetical protein
MTRPPASRVVSLVGHGIRFSWRLVAAPVVGGLIGAHLFFVMRAPNATGLLLIAEHALTLAAVVCFLALCAAVGMALVARTRLAIPDHASALGIAVVLGSGVLGTVILVAGWFGGLQPLALVAILLGAGVLARSEIVRIPSVVRSCWHEVRTETPLAMIFMFAAAACALTALALAPPSDYDSLMYHIDLPAEFLRAGRVFLPPDNLHVAQVGLVHMLYLPLLALVGPAAPALLEVGFLILLALAIFGAGRRLFGGTGASLAMLGMWGTTTLTLTGATAKVDAALVLFLFLAQYLLMVSDAAPGRGWHRVALAGLLTGLAVGVKLHAGVYALALVPLVCWDAVTSGGWRAAPRAVLVFGLAGVVGALPWLVKNMLLLGAPFYPLLTKPQLPPWLAEAYGVRFTTAESSAVVGFLESARVPISLGDLLFDPARLTPEAEANLYFLNPLLAAAPLCVFLFRGRTAAGLLIPPLLYAAGLLTYTRHSNVRYLIPAFVPLAVAGAAAAGALIDRFFTSGRRSVALSLLGVLSVAPTAYALCHRIQQTEVAKHILGLRSRFVHLRAGRDFEIASHLQFADRVNTSLSNTASVLMLFEGRGYYFRVPVLQDNLFTNWPLAVLSGGIDDCFHRAGVTHLLLGTSTLEYFVNRGANLRDTKWSEFENFSRRCLREVESNRDYTLFAVVR